MPSNIRLWATLGISGLVILFILQNIVTVEVTFLFWTIKLPRAILLFIVFGLGVLLGRILKSTQGPARRPE